MLQGDLARRIERVEAAAAELDQIGSAEALEALAWLNDWCRRARVLPLVGFAGTFSSGKSSLINGLVGANVLAVSPNPSTRGPVELVFGEIEATLVGDGGDVRLLPLKHLHRTDTHRAEGPTTRLRAFVRSDLLRTFRLLDTPGFAEPGANAQVTIRALADCDVVVWCTDANRAWTQEDRTEFNRLPEKLRRCAILAVTRTDKLNTQTQADQVLMRLRSETNGCFSHIVRTAVPKNEAPLGMAEIGKAIVQTLGDQAGRNHQRELCQELDTRLQLLQNSPLRDVSGVRIVTSLVQDLLELAGEFMESEKEVESALQTLRIANCSGIPSPEWRGKAAVEAYRRGHEQRECLRLWLRSLLPQVQILLDATDPNSNAGGSIDQPESVARRLHRASQPENADMLSWDLTLHANGPLSTEALAKRVKSHARVRGTAELLLEAAEELKIRYEVASVATGTVASTSFSRVSEILSDLLVALTSQAVSCAPRTVADAV